MSYMKEGIYKFYVDCGRMGDVQGLFIATADEVKSILGERIYFGEILGKHSEVVLTIEKENITFVTDDENFVGLFKKYDLTSGHNPFDYWEQED